MRKHKKLFVSFWNIALENFPEGAFSHRTIPAAEAKTFIDAAKEAEQLVCVTKDDFFAPYKERELRGYKKLADALRDELSIDIQLEQFTFQPEGAGGMHCIKPLTLAALDERSDLLVVNCCFVGGAPKNAKTIEEKLDFPIAVDSITLHLFERLSA